MPRCFSPVHTNAALLLTARIKPRYDMMFATYNLSSAQILAIEGDADDPDTLRQVRDTTAELLSMGTIPIINENDAVTGRTKPVVNVNNEVSWDNDVLKGATADSADVLVLMTDMDALYIKPDPKAAAAAAVLSRGRRDHDRRARPGRPALLPRCRRDGRPFARHVRAAHAPLARGARGACTATSAIARRRPPSSPPATTLTGSSGCSRARTWVPSCPAAPSQAVRIVVR